MEKMFLQLHQRIVMWLLLGVIVVLGPRVDRVECATPKIIGGWHISIEDAPYHVAIAHWEYCRIMKLGRWAYRCGGTIVNEWWILTAGHCIVDATAPRTQLVKPAIAASLIAVAPARDSKDYSRQWLESIFIRVGLVVPHPQYVNNGSYFRNDIGLLRLEEPLLWSAKIQPAVLPSGSYFPQEYTQACVTGFGIIDPYKRVKDNRLKAHCAHIHIHRYCAAKGKYFQDVALNASMPFPYLCWVARYFYSRLRLTHICDGDSGSGLTKKLANGSFLIVGVATHSAQHCGLGEDLFFQVSYYETWIRSVIEKVPPERKSK